MRLIHLLTLLVILLSGCNNITSKEGSEKGAWSGTQASYAFLEQLKGISICLNKTNQGWEQTMDFSGNIMVRFDNRTEKEIFKLSSRHNVSIKEPYAMGNVIFVKFKINENLPPEKICNFLNDKTVSAHYPEQTPHTT